MAREKTGFWVGTVAAVFYPLTWMLGGRTAQHSERIPRHGGAIVFLNHVSHIDPAYDAVFIHRNQRVPRIFAKESLFRKPIFGRMITGAGAIPVYRGSARAADSLKAAKLALQAGKLILIYPEGTITKDPNGWPMESRNGIARLALECDVPVIPVARWGTLDILDAYRRRFRPFPRAHIRYNVGEPIDLSGYRGKRAGAKLLTEVTTVCMREVTALLAELRGEPAPDGFYDPKAEVSPAKPAAEGGA
ncbi:MAG: lysophospholipid acyltransferase family protein [Sciscionella sp.]